MKHIVKEKTNFMKKEFIYIIIGVFFVSCLNIVGIRTIINKSFTHKETKEFCYSEEFRKQCLDDAFINEIRKSHNVGEKVASYLYKKESVRMDYEEYQKYIKNIWDRVKFFPVAEFLSQTTYTISYSNSWMNERTYGGTRGHEGTDIMAKVNKRGKYYVVSMTDGIVSKMGWLEKGGYRIGITTEEGIYFYYAHLESYANLKVGDKVKAGDFLGFMGDSGYGPIGTIGQFPVHLHIGIYIIDHEKEISINPYRILRYVENRTIKCYTEE
jgi:murein DD-endopeptidase MepM/ murein hydrolase activator NlpD